MGLPKRNESESINKQEERLARVLQNQESCKLGYMLGFHDGYDSAVKHVFEHIKPIVSDGLRAGSSLCGKEMRRYRKD
jgi:hypothetical protein